MKRDESYVHQVLLTVINAVGIGRRKCAVRTHYVTLHEDLQGGVWAIMDRMVWLSLTMHYQLALQTYLLPTQQQDINLINDNNLKIYMTISNHQSYQTNSMHDLHFCTNPTNNCLSSKIFFRHIAIMTYCENEILCKYV